MPRPIKIAPCQSFKDLQTKFYALGDENFCSPLAFANLTGLPVEKVSKLFLILGRPLRRGTRNDITKTTFSKLGYSVTSVSPSSIIKTYPGGHVAAKFVTSHHPRRFPNSFDGKNYFMASNTHAWSVKNGQLVDWSINKSLRASIIWEISSELDFNEHHEMLLDEYLVSMGVQKQ